MPASVVVRRPPRALAATLALPRSKSVANRALVLAQLAGDMASVKALPDADDTRTLWAALREKPHAMECGLGGTTYRFLLAWAAVQHGSEHLVAADDALLQRPHEDLVHALRQLGADLTPVPKGYRVRGKRLAGGTITFHRPISSQYLSALLLVGTTMRKPLELIWSGPRMSEPYVAMTLRALRHYGAQVEHNMDRIVVHPGPLRPLPLEVPVDWSAAAFWFQLAALGHAGARYTISHLNADGWQGDEHAQALWMPWVQWHSGVLQRAARAAEPPREWDLRNTPDLLQPLVFTCACLGVRAHFTGLASLPYKETDRLVAVAAALVHLGLAVHHTSDSLHISGAITRPDPVPFDSRGDHRMAMALAPLANVCEQITILQPGVVSKSYPAFWDHLALAGYRLEWS
jgi:3-phosphoshikimate 1-carboxyvinyltransferase